MQNLWYKNAIVYSLDVETFMDSDGDGVGDFPGLTQKLDYLAGLGITCLWLLPFYPSPNRDNGYDVMDYYGVDPRLGTLGDFVEFMHKARERGIRVIVDLVVNHTSIAHPWFQEARSDRNSKYRNYYVWSDNPPPADPKQIAFPDVEDSLWDYDDKAGAYYLHHFYKEQPDLNIANPAVREEICKIMGFWLELGVSGFRIDAAPFLIQGIGIPDAKPEDLEGFLIGMREFLVSRRADAILLAEANVDADQIGVYFGNGDKMQMLFSFLLNQHMFLALARQDAATLVEGLKILPDAHHNCQWLNFVRHHDELTLDRLQESEIQEIFQAFAPEENMQMWGRGVRRRLPPMLEGDRQQVELVYSLLLTLPGTPMLRYGEEIGMGDDLSLEGRGSVRTVMQWSSKANGGFSSAPADKLARPAIDRGEYGYQKLNVTSQQRDPNSILSWMERAIRTRKQYPEFGSGKWKIVATNEPSVFAHSSQQNGNTVIAVHNLSAQSCSVSLKSAEYPHLLDVFSDRPYEQMDCHSNSIEISGYGYRWFQVN
ncbi:trehalose synthase [Chroococcidiopsis sp. CCALA 051]|uniref:alpha-amylase family protein n=1 Tax=Chroococcidiopsis sp. CCALA 051 TaxID=869949 RepID=UPI000D0E1C79|nr:alpha-amylase family protein [Chroococcidiopsis sp. CCALA 051]MBE9018788.1 alpha-amylase family protein [Chroococcidiopsidales cyanobacterium LEGE 13417]PSM49521.1 trehalose synthase [Chroococcidiopsis sp. CCALA 051]